MNGCCKKYRGYRLDALKDALRYDLPVKRDIVRKKYCPECGGSLTPNFPETLSGSILQKIRALYAESLVLEVDKDMKDLCAVYCINCKHVEWHEPTGEVSCKHPDNCTPDWWSETGICNRRPENINAGNDCGWYEAKC